MIAGCPSCATRGDVLAGHSGEDARVGRCLECGHDWIESTAVEIFDGGARNAARSRAIVPVDHGHDLDREARRLVDAARLTAKRYQELRRRRRASLRGWAMLAIAVLVPLAGAIAFPESVIRVAPAAARIYSLAGLEVNIFGFVIRDATSELRIESGTVLLAVRGEVVNVTDRAAKAPALRFVLRDGAGQEDYVWTLDGVGSRLLDAGEATSFLTRVAAPPAHVREVEIGFARAE